MKNVILGTPTPNILTSLNIFPISGIFITDPISILGNGSSFTNGLIIILKKIAGSIPYLPKASASLFLFLKSLNFTEKRR